MSTKPESRWQEKQARLNGRCTLCGAPASGRKHVMVKGFFGFVSLTTRVCTDCYIESATAWAREELKKGPENGGQRVQP